MNAPWKLRSYSPAPPTQPWISRGLVSTPAGFLINERVFAATGQWAPMPGLPLVSLLVECVGGGGGGAGIFLPTALYAGSGGGGGSGGYSRIMLPASVVVGGVAVTIGQGGGPSEVVGTAPNGTPTSFGSMCVANGGFGGVSATTTSWGGGGQPGVPGVGDIAMAGNTGSSGYLLTGVAAGSIGMEAGGGAPSFFGGGVRGGGNQGTTAPGKNAPANSGAGGAGAWQNWVSVSVATPGGAGGTGICIVTEFYSLASACGCGCGDEAMASGLARIGFYDEG